MTLIDDPVSQQGPTDGPTRAGRRPFRRRLVVGLVTAGAVAGVVAGVVVGRAEGIGAGPLTTDTGPAAAIAYGVPSLRLGEGFCYGAVIISNPSRSAARLESVEISGGSGLSVGTARVLGDGRSETIATGETCPTTAPEAKGYVVPAGAGTTEHDSGVELLLPIRIDRPGKHRIDGIWVTYRVGRTSYRVQDGGDVVACTYRCGAEPGGR